MSTPDPRPPLRILIRRRLGHDEFQASVEGKPWVWGAGRTQSEALGDLVLGRPDLFGVEIEDEQTQSQSQRQEPSSDQEPDHVA